MSIAADSAIPVRLIVCPEGMIRPYPVQSHTCPSVCELGSKRFDRRNGVDLPRSVKIKQARAAEGWAWLDDLYDTERRSLEIAGKKKGKAEAAGARLAELNKGQRVLFNLQKEHGAGRPVAVTWNRGSGASKGKIKMFPENYLPAVIAKRRDTAESTAYTFDLELEQQPAA